VPPPSPPSPPPDDAYRARITLEPGKRGGKLTIRGLRITVYNVLSYLAAGVTPEELLADFPSLKAEAIRACLSYAADRAHRLLVAPAGAAPRHSRRCGSTTTCRPASSRAWPIATPAPGTEPAPAWSEPPTSRSGPPRPPTAAPSCAAALRGSPPKVIWLRLGNCTTGDVERALRGAAEAITAFLTDPVADVLELV
jgi:uncharacterized protein (DUF433 family)